MPSMGSLTTRSSPASPKPSIQPFSRPTTLSPPTTVCPALHSTHSSHHCTLLDWLSRKVAGGLSLSLVCDTCWLARGRGPQQAHCTLLDIHVQEGCWRPPSSHQSGHTQMQVSSMHAGGSLLLLQGRLAMSGDPQVAVRLTACCNNYSVVVLIG